MTNNKHDKNFKVAIKVMDKEKLGEHIGLIIDEVNTLNELDHPNIVKYFETYNDHKYIYLVMEYVKGKPLFDKITN
jgi:serine/threonine protein kinase